MIEVSARTDRPGGATGFVFSGRLGDLCHFAYGANMNGEQLRLRGIKPVAVSIARLPGHRVAFHGYSGVWDGAVETVVPAPGEDTWGVLYKLEVMDGEVLDLWQDARQDGSGAYFHYPAEVTDPAGETRMVLLYKKDVLGTPEKPSREYLDFIVQGAVEHGLPASYIEKLRQTESKPAEYPVPRRGKSGRNFYAVTSCAECGGASGAAA
ncbi:hypothetical protein OpiT1DRAFT_00739 [Opitutaceae bacterium TAV1]|nr:hypothetical protein OpiT1DRAFT_00739 [Opitutaceae bacterium TAV1]